jgi:D-alanyl-lipoteichoic acid acyltransferase DltB (MBOAT superfamily)
MQVNVGSKDRWLRVLVGLILVILTILGKVGPWGWLGLVLIATGALRFCPGYKILGISTESKSS